ncbi:MAG: hypothetical protein CMF49_03390 [Legionellales bacterium]|nr:hypothetical protein [Legionellales bacterium]|tara:strand:+ start:2396 stop:2584 length:189 start_codon:yes stop_codon:yes gene_type:complete
MHEYSGLFGIIILALDLWAIISTLSSHKSTGKKVFWCLIVLLLPIFGFIIWLLFGPRAIRPA